MNLPLLTQHSLLERQGGAARIADLLCHGLAAAGHSCLRTFELAEADGAEQGFAPLVASVRAGGLPHLHATADWAGLLGTLARTGATGRLVITLHDCRLFTGGCPYPLDCPHLADGCVDDCPRGHAGAAARRAAQARALEAARPMLTAPSRWMRLLAESHLPGHSVRVIPNGVPFPESLSDLAPKEEARRAFGIDPSAPVALLAAHGAEAAQFKGGHRWAELRAAVNGLLPGVLWVVAGGDEVAAEPGLLRLPYLPQDRLNLLMRAADLFVYPTLADNHPLVILEAMAAALPTISFAAGGVPEQVTDGATGCLVPPGDWRAMAERTAVLLKSPGRLRRTGEEAFRLGRPRFSLERMIREHADLYGRCQRLFPCRSSQ